MFPRKKNPKSRQSCTRQNDESIDQQILKALSNTKFKARTVSGIAAEIKQPKILVVERLRSEILKSQVKIYPRRAKNGSILITTKAIFDQKADLIDKFIDVFSTNHLGLTDVK